MDLHFHLPSLPNELLHLIFNYVQFEQSIDFLEVSKRLRTHVLQFGPFPGNLDQIEYIFNNNPNQGPFYRCLIFFLDQVSKSNLSIKFSQDGVSHLKYQGKNWTSKTFQTCFDRESPRIISNLIQKCRNLKLNISGFQNEMLRNFFEQQKFLPNLRAIANFSIVGTWPYLIYPLVNFCPKVENICSIALSDSLDEYPKAEVCEDFRKWAKNPAFDQTKIFYLFGDIQYYFEALSKKKFEILLRFDEDEADFHKTIQQFVTFGIPGENRESAAIFAHTFLEHHISFQAERIKMKGVFDEMLDLLLDIRNVEIISDASNHAHAHKLRDFFDNNKFSNRDETFLCDVNETFFYRLRNSPDNVLKSKFLRKTISNEIEMVLMVILENETSRQEIDEEEDREEDYQSKFHLKLFIKHFERTH